MTVERVAGCAWKTRPDKRGLGGRMAWNAHRRSWQSREAVELATLAWVDWFNHRRLLEPIGNIPPAEAEAIYYRHLTESAQAA